MKNDIETWKTSLLFINWKVSKSGEIKPIAFINPVIASKPSAAKVTKQPPARKIAINKFIIIQSAIIDPQLAINIRPFQQITIQVQWTKKTAMVTAISGDPVFTYYAGTPQPKPYFSTNPAISFSQPFALPNVCPSCHSNIEVRNGKLYCPSPAVCPAQRGNINTVKASNPQLRISYPMFVTDDDFFIHACNLYGAIPVPSNFKETSYNFEVLASSEETFGFIGYYMGLFSPQVISFERRNSAEIIASTRATLRDYMYI